MRFQRFHESNVKQVLRATVGCKSALLGGKGCAQKFTESLRSLRTPLYAFRKFVNALPWESYSKDSVHLKDG